MSSTMFCLVRPHGSYVNRSLPSTVVLNRRRLMGVRTWAKPDKDESERPESLFAKELRRRGIPQDTLNPTNKSFSQWTLPGQEAYDDTRRETKNQPYILTEDQLKRSRLLNNEGLAGFLPRAKELLTLGATSTFAFIPAIGIVVLFAMTLYIIFGESFVHSGSLQTELPGYVDPSDLLEYPFNDQVSVSGPKRSCPNCLNDD